MASTDDELQSEVRELTDYTDTTTLSDSALDEVFDIAKRDIQSEANTTISTWYDDLDKENALFWTACLFTKVKAGELDGVPMSLGDIDYGSLKAAGEGSQDKPVIWYEKAKRYTDCLVSGGGRFAVRSIDRGGSRQYGDDSGDATL